MKEKNKIFGRGRKERKKKPVEKRRNQEREIRVGKRERGRMRENM